MNIVKLAYFDDFQCMGGECPDSCCKEGWHIWLSKREYLNYKKMDMKPEFRKLADKCFKRTKGSISDYGYAEILHIDEGCSFLTEDGLCGLQKELGEKALGYVCRTFPRNYVYIKDQAVTMSCLATCCHVTELLMQHPEGLGIIEGEYEGKQTELTYLYSLNESWKGFSYYWNILNAEIDILQNRSFSISERMLILGYFCSKADEYIEKGNAEKIPALSDMLLDNELCRRIADSLKPTAADEAAKARESVTVLLNMYVRVKGVSMSGYSRLFDRVMERLGFSESGLGETGEVSGEFDGAEYEKLRGVYRGIEEERSFITENLLVNTVFTQKMSTGIWRCFFVLAVLYNMLGIMVPAFLPDKYGDEELALALTYAVKLVINTHAAEKGTFEDYVKENKCTLPYAAFLVG